MQAGKMLEDAGDLDNTLVIVAADNGMPFPRAKANLYEFGFHEPLAVRWPARAPGGRVWETYKRYSPIRQFPPPARR